MEFAVRALCGYRVGDRVRLVAPIPDANLPKGARGVVCRASFLSVSGQSGQNQVGVQFERLAPLVVPEAAIAGGWAHA